MEGIRAFSSTDRSDQLQSITIMLLQEQHITTFTQAAGAVLKDIVYTAEIKQATASDKQIKLPTAATTSRDRYSTCNVPFPILDPSSVPFRSAPFREIVPARETVKPDHVGEAPRMSSHWSARQI